MHSAKIDSASEPLEQEDNLSLQSVLSTWASYGFTLFIRLTEIETPACQQLLKAQDNISSIEQQTATELREKWPEFCSWVQQTLLDDVGPVNRLCRHFELDLAELFLIALLSEIEYNHLLSLAIRELQQPEEEIWLSVNLAEAICDNLFSEHSLRTEQLVDNKLLESGVIKFLGEGPLVVRQLSLDLLFWKALFATKFNWQGVALLAEQDFSLLPAINENDLPLRASEQLTCFMLKGDTENNILYAAQLSHYWDKQAVQVSLKDWQQQPTLRLACQLTQSIPIIELPESDQQIQLNTNQYQGVLFLIANSQDQVLVQNLLEMQIPELKRNQRMVIWQQLLDEQQGLANSFQHVHINGTQIQRMVNQARHLAGENTELSVQHLRQAWEVMSHESLSTLAQTVDRTISKHALVLPKKTYQQLDDFMLRCQQREALWEGLGVTASGSTNFGVRGLFVGESGTGKTLAASYLATQLGMPLYRVDISAIMNKYVGESEKNLNRLFNYASRFDVMLLLDEADSLFGRRGEQDDQGSRFGNMLTNFLLTRIESYSGIVILTSNSRSRIDPAFIRRLDSIIEFPRPEFSERLGIWQSHLGQRSPGEEVCRRLASYCELAGGAIRNAVLFAAVRQQHINALDLLDGLAAEYGKLGKPLPTELQQWRQTEVKEREGA